MVGYPGSQDIDQHPYYPYRLAKLAWHVYHHSFTKNGRWFLAGTVIANLSFVMFWSFDIQTWILATAINCIWLPDFIAKMIPLTDTVALSSKVIVPNGDTVTLVSTIHSLSPNSLVHFERLPLALTSIHDEGFVPSSEGLLSVTLRARFRGNWVVPSLRISRPGPFGLVARSRVIPANIQICVLPPVPETRSVQAAQTVLSELRLNKNSGKHPMAPGVDVIRTHTPGDPSNRIDWRGSSRTAATSRPALQVRVAQTSAVDGVIIIVDERVITTSISQWQHWSGRGIREPLPIPEFEALISVAYTSALSLLREGRRIASISSQRQSFSQPRTRDDIAVAFSSISHFETPQNVLGKVPPPLIPDENCLLFTLVPELYSAASEMRGQASFCIMSDVNGVITGEANDA